MARPTAWAAYAACALALLSAVPSFYWALGGTAGLATVGGTIEELARARDPAWHHGRASLDREAGHRRPRVAQAADRRPRRSM
jgi:hypothetical protein